MGIPYSHWGRALISPNSYPYQYAIPAIPPSSHPLIINPEGAIRDYTSKCFADGGQNYLCDATAQALLGDWAKNEDYRKIIMEVVKINLDLAWPYNYKAVDILSVMPESAMLENHDKLKALSETPNSERGAAELKKIVKPLLEKADAAKKKKDDEEAEEIQKAIIGMWGGLWANNGQVPGNLNQAGWHGYQYPWNGAPGVAAQAVSEWKGKAPDGWTGSSITPVPQIYPFSRTGYLALMSMIDGGEEEKKEAEPKATGYTITITPGNAGPAKGGVSKYYPLGLDQLEEAWKAQLAARGW